MVHIGTLCSGIDYVLHSTASFWILMTCVIDHVIVPVQAFACENVERKRDWLRHLGHTKSLYPDVTQLSQPFVTNAFCRERQQRVPVRECDQLWVGWECDDASMMSMNRAGRKQCVRTGEGKTGSTFQGMMGYVENRKINPPDMIVGENVVGHGLSRGSAKDGSGHGCTKEGSCLSKNQVRGDSQAPAASEGHHHHQHHSEEEERQELEAKTNTDFALQALRSSGRQALAAVVHSKRGGAPCPRPRLFVWSPKDNVASMSTEDAYAMMADVAAAVDLEQCPVSEWVLSPEDPRVQAWLAAPPCNRPENKFANWKSDYLLIGQQYGFDFKTLEEVAAAAAQLEAYARIPQAYTDMLTEREKLCLQMCYLMAEKEDLNNDDVTLAWDISQSFGRIPKQRNMCPSILPNGLIWIHQGRVQARPQVPTEALLVQGIDLASWGVEITPVKSQRKRKTMEEQLPGSFTWSEVMDLAGNAFNMYSLNQAVLLSHALWSGGLPCCSIRMALYRPSMLQHRMALYQPPIQNCHCRPML